MTSIPRNVNTYKRNKPSVGGYGSGAENIAHGPWDLSDKPDIDDRYDFGAIRVRGIAGAKIELIPTAGTNLFFTVAQVFEDSMMQVEVYAAPKSSGIWDELREAMILSLKKQNAQVQEDDGPWGKQVLAFVPTTPGATEGQIVRVIGVDGPRWFLRASIFGKAAVDPEVGVLYLQALSDYVVVRGDRPAPVGEALPLTGIKGNIDPFAADGSVSIPDIGQ